MELNDVGRIRPDLHPVIILSIAVSIGLMSFIYIRMTRFNKALAITYIVLITTLPLFILFVLVVGPTRRIGG